MKLNHRRKTTTMMAAVALTVSMLGLVAPTTAADSGSHTSLTTLREQLADLPEPFASWDVRITEKSDEPGALDLSYDSPLLGRRTHNAVYLPTSYQETGTPWPVLYFLHGTVLPVLDDPALDPVTCVDSLMCMISGGGGNKQVLLQDFPSQRNNAQFIVVAPDTNPDKNWCETCPWIDGRDDIVPNLPPLTAETVPAESVLYKEVFPLVEAVFNARTDRGGRGISGFSLGALGAFIQGLRHPDRFAYVASISGAYDIVDEPVMSNALSALGDFRDQGYGTPQTHTIWWRNFNPKDLITNVRGSGVELMISAGDICLPPTDQKGREACQKYPSLLNPGATTVEITARRNTDLSIQGLAEASVSAQQVRFSGIHGANNHRVYADVIVPQANRIFGREPTTSETFSYKTVDPRMSVWGYEVTVERPTPEFLQIQDARRDGTAFALLGNGNVDVATPPTFEPGLAYRVVISSSTETVQTRNATADHQGRIRTTVDLGDPAFKNTAGALDLLGSTDPYAKVTIEDRD